jgi:hypothetical protein
LPIHLSLGLPRGLFPFGFPTNILYAILLDYPTFIVLLPSHNTNNKPRTKRESETQNT